MSVSIEQVLEPYALECFNETVAKRLKEKTELTAEDVTAASQLSLCESAKRQADALERIASMMADNIGPYGGFQVTGR